MGAHRVRSTQRAAPSHEGARGRLRVRGRAGVGGIGNGEPREQIAKIQRSRLLAAAAGEIDARGYARTTVAHIASRARVSRRTFYELFTNRDECLTAVLDEAVALVEGELVAASLGKLSWREQVRQGLWIVLSLFDSEPVLARVCVVQALRGGSAVLERREQILARLAATVDEGRGESAHAVGYTTLTAEGVVGAAFTILYSRLSRPTTEPLTSLLGELCAMIVLPYLGAAAARREQARPAPLPRVAREPRATAGSIASPADPLGSVPMRLTYRTAKVLEGIGERPGISNRQVADHAGIHDQGQVSKLLARLERLGLLHNGGAGAHAKGERNAWTLTLAGEQVTRSIRMHTAIERQAA